MRKISQAILVLGVLATGCLVFNMIAISARREELLSDQAQLALIGFIILGGFLLILLFNLSSLAWWISQVRNRYDFGLAALIAGAIGCLFLMLGEKTMIDEIARENRLGWETAGEWIILYFFLSVQLIYNLAVLLCLARRHIKRSLQIGPSAH